ncbi:MAG: YkgJ family cysteine cluster protein [Anaeromyxobacteraceae bacterium]
METCRGGCCRGPLLLHLTVTELEAFRAHAARLGVPLHVREAPGGGAAIAFDEHPGDHCPMLDGATSACRIYEARPSRCRTFPDRRRPDCILSIRSFPPSSER